MAAKGAMPRGGWTLGEVAAELLACEDERREREPFTCAPSLAGLKGYPLRMPTP